MEVEGYVAPKRREVISSSKLFLEVLAVFVGAALEQKVKTFQRSFKLKMDLR